MAFVRAAIAAENPDISPGHIATLVKQLGSPKFTERRICHQGTRCHRRPGGRGFAIRKQFSGCRDARPSDGPSQAHRASGAVDALLKPTMVSLDFDDTPLEEAVKKLCRDAGMPLELPMPARYLKRKVTVKSGPLPVWEALELFCRKTDLHEWDPSVPPPNGVPQTTQVVAQGNVVLGGVQGS